LTVEVLSALFRRLFLEMLVAAHDAGQLQFFGDQVGLADKAAFEAYLRATGARYPLGLRGLAIHWAPWTQGNRGSQETQQTLVCIHHPDRNCETSDTILCQTLLKGLP
jgi:hypothetical protein